MKRDICPTAQFIMTDTDI